jgi:hypothetical protein
MPGAWYFRGSCATGTVAKAGATFALAHNDGGGKVPFIVGDAVGDGQVTGKLGSQFLFPAFGNVRCVAFGGAKANCAGNAFLYIVAINAGNVTMTFDASPTIAILNARSFGETNRCNLYTLVWTNEGHADMAWAFHGVTAIATGRQLVFQPVSQPQEYKSGGAFTVFAIVCP